MIAAGGADSGRFCTNRILFGSPSCQASACSTAHKRIEARAKGIHARSPGQHQGHTPPQACRPPHASCSALRHLRHRHGLQQARACERTHAHPHNCQQRLAAGARTALGSGSLELLALVLGDVGACSRCHRQPQTAAYMLLTSQTALRTRALRPTQTHAKGVCGGRGTICAGNNV